MSQSVEQTREAMLKGFQQFVTAATVSTAALESLSAEILSYDIERWSPEMREMLSAAAPAVVAMIDQSRRQYERGMLALESISNLMWAHCSRG